MNCKIFKCPLNGGVAPGAAFNYDEYNFEKSFLYHIEIN